MQFCSPSCVSPTAHCALRRCTSALDRACSLVIVHYSGAILLSVVRVPYSPSCTTIALLKVIYSIPLTVSLLAYLWRNVVHLSAQAPDA